MNAEFSQSEYEDFKNSLFLKKGEIIFRNDQVELRNNRVMIYDTNIYRIDEFLLNRDIINRPDNINTHQFENTVYVSLFNSLMFSTLSKDIKKKIVSQWTSTLKVINQIEIGPSYSGLVISLGGSDIKKHKHESFTKQTLTFQFEFPKFLNHLYEDTINLYDDTGDITYKLQPRKTNKSIFTFRDNVVHGGVSRHLKFFWYYDYEKYVDLTNIDLGNFEFIDFNPV